MRKSNPRTCFACKGLGEVKVIKTITKIGPFHFGKETVEECIFCKDGNLVNRENENQERTLY